MEMGEEGDSDPLTLRRDVSRNTCRQSGFINTHNVEAELPEALLPFYSAPQYQIHMVAYAPPQQEHHPRMSGGAGQAPPQLLSTRALFPQQADPHLRVSPGLILCSENIRHMWGESGPADCCETTFIKGFTANPTSSLSVTTRDAPLFTDRKFLGLAGEDVRIYTLSSDINGGDNFQELESNYSSNSESEDMFLLMPPNHHLGLSVFSMLCCFWPLGIAAFYLSHETNKAASKGDFHQASSTSRRALFLAVLSITIGTGIYVGMAVALIAYLSKSHRW
ncbi:synapse differentiation-inducing gene protein 1 [Thalassophryne amazonica]|uniref:synapse differentiation-inducing gene protein 1 n=1 Tax=Thalassophryne amazonica TaxID=390379 RepID=UPI0014717385|nr:synapse differentiation-inducing gene protein 1 [Thalassophryne amazonica]